MDTLLRSLWGLVGKDRRKSIYIEVSLFSAGQGEKCSLTSSCFVLGEEFPVWPTIVKDRYYDLHFTERVVNRNSWPIWDAFQVIATQGWWTDMLAALKPIQAPARTVLLWSSKDQHSSESEWKPGVPESKPGLIPPHPLVLLWCSLAHLRAGVTGQAPHLVTDLSNTSHCTNYHVMRGHILLVPLTWLRLSPRIVSRDIMGLQSYERLCFIHEENGQFMSLECH